MLKRPQYLSQLFHPIEAVPKENVATSSASNSFKLMLKNGIISHSSPGIFNLMPIAVKSLEKLYSLVDSIMTSIGGQKVMLPTLTQATLWKKSGRWENPTAQLFKVQDRHGVEYCLGPTHEEAATKMVATSVLPIRNLPLKIYQISTKFRDEANPKLGLLRGREFIMKDMYTFDVSEDKALAAYSDVCDAYGMLFKILGINHVRVTGSSIGMGGSLSHEYHFLSNVGEDKLLVCPNCKEGYNREVLDLHEKKCSSCGNILQEKCGIEVGHTFYLGTAYSKPFKAKYKGEDGTLKELLMGCYGLGMTRILAASIECLSSEHSIRWPSVLSPFLISIIPPKKGSREEKANYFVDYLFQTLSSVDDFQNSIVVDDRVNLSIGKRVQEADSMGIPYTIVAGSAVLNPVPKVELISNYTDEKYLMTHSELMSYIRNVKNYARLE